MRSIKEFYKDKKNFSKLNISLIAIFLLALLLRFLYFPENIYFGFDQARDAFTALSILKGHFILIGPTSSLQGLFHGVLYDYFIAPIYFLSRGDPILLSVVMRILNSLGIFVVFYLVYTLFIGKGSAKLIALLTCLFYAVSFEQTQFSIYMEHPSLANLTVPLMYLGLALVIFAKKSWGLIFSFFFLGLSIEFEIGLVYLVLPVCLILIIFRRYFLRKDIKVYLFSLMALFLSVSSYILADFRYNFRSFKVLTHVSQYNPNKELAVEIKSYFVILSDMLRLNLLGDLPIKTILLILILFLFVFLLIKRSDLRENLIFLGIWFFSLFGVYIVYGGRASGEQLYYTNAGVSISLYIFIALLLSLIVKRYLVLVILITTFILAVNLQMILSYNSKGTITSFNVQQGMLLEQEKRVLDLIYKDAGGEKFAAKALTLPLFINTTWSYLYEWYGKGKYGYLPVWGDKNALGYYGNLSVVDAQDSLPKKRYLVVEPVTGLPKYAIDDYLRIEGYFTNIEWEKRVGFFRLQKRLPIKN